MATIAEHISTLRHLIKNYSDDSFYEDQFLYKLLKDARAFLLEREAKKMELFSDFSEQVICMPLVLDTYHDCDCLPVNSNCKVLKSKYPIPDVIMGRSRYLMKVKTIDGEHIGYVKDSSLYKKWRYSKTKKDKIFWTIFNDHLIIFGTTTLGVVIIEAVFEDPEALSDISFCEDEETTGCYDVSNDNFPIKASLFTPMYAEAMRMLSLPLQIQEDLTNDNISQNA